MEQPLGSHPLSELSSYPARPPPETIQDPVAYENNRAASDFRLKSRWEQIFSKYEHDFTGIGDEIDLEEFVLAVDNGHLQNSTNECDAGQSGPLRSVRNRAAFEDDRDRSGSEIDSSDEDSSGAESTGSTFEEPTFLEPEDAPILDSATSRTGDEQSDDTGRSGILSTLSILQSVPGLKESLSTVRAHPDDPSRHDTHTIEALGMSIAKHLSDFMRARPPQQKPSLKRSVGIWDYPELPTSKRQCVENPNPPASTTALITAEPNRPVKSKRAEGGSESLSLWAPLALPPRSRRRRKPKQPVNENREHDENAHAAELSSKACVHCGIRVTSHWRKCSKGDLCNACGVFYWRWGEMKPLEHLDYVTQETEVEDEEDYAANTSRTRKATSWTTQDDALIIKLKEIDRYSWTEIATFFPNRGAWSMQARYDKFLKRQECPGRAILVEQGFCFPLKGIEFTAAEEKKLVDLKSRGIAWEEVAQQMPQYSIDALTAQHKFLLAVQEADETRDQRRPKVTHPRYVAGEDDAVQKLREVYGLTFEEITELCSSRTPMGLQKRYSRGLAQRKKAHEEIHGEGTFIVPKAPPRIGCYDTQEVEQSMQESDEPDESDGSEGSDGQTCTLLCPTDYRFKFSKEEDGQLRTLRGSTALDWDEIALRFPNRSIASLKERWGILQVVLTLESIMTEKPVEPQSKKHKTDASTTQPRKKDVADTNLFNSLLRETPAPFLCDEKDPTTVGEPEFDILTLTSDSKSSEHPLKLQPLSWRPTVAGISVERPDALSPTISSPTHVAIQDTGTDIPKNNPSLVEWRDIVHEASADVNESTHVVISGPIRQGTPSYSSANNEPGHATPGVSPLRTAAYGTPTLHNIHRTPYFLASPTRLAGPGYAHLEPAQAHFEASRHVMLDAAFFDDSAPTSELEQPAAHQAQQCLEIIPTNETDAIVAPGSDAPATNGHLSGAEPSVLSMITEAMIANGKIPISTYKINRYFAQHFTWFTFKYKYWKRRIRDCLLSEPRFKKLREENKFELETNVTQAKNEVGTSIPDEHTWDNCSSSHASASRKSTTASINRSPKNPREAPCVHENAEISDPRPPEDDLIETHDVFDGEAFSSTPQTSDQHVDSGDLFADVPMYEDVRTPLNALQARAEDTLGPEITKEPLSSSPTRPVLSRPCVPPASTASLACDKQGSWSSPVLVKKKSPLKVVYGRRRSLDAVHTPKNAASAFLADRRRKGTLFSTPATSTTGFRRGSSVTRLVPGSIKKRIVETPLREKAAQDSDEDELA